jgi:hypothetical protein
VLKPPRNKLDRSASGAFDAAEANMFPEAAELVSLFCDAPNVLLNPKEVAAGGGLANDEKRLGLGDSEGALALGSGALMLLNKVGFGVAAFSSGSLIAPNGFVAGAFSCAWGVCWPKLNAGVVDAAAGARFANGLLAGADDGVLEPPPNMFGGGAVDVVLLFCCAVEVEAKLNRLVVGAGAVAGAFPVPCALVPMLNRLFWGVSC